MSEANKDLFTLFMNSWSEYVNTWSIMHNQSI